MDTQPKLLLIETATEICAVAVTEGPTIRAQRIHTQSMAHARLITVFIEQVLKEAGWDIQALHAVVLSKGPGSYTALRVGTSAAKAICYALDKPLIAVSTLQALAWAARDTYGSSSNVYYVPMIDARRMDVYTAIYDGHLQPISPPQPLTLEAHTFDTFLAQGYTLVFAGNGAAKYQELRSHPHAVFLDQLQCSAAYLAALGLEAFTKAQFESIAHFTPEYIKPPHITTPKKKLC